MDGMGRFNDAFAATMRREGGYVLHKVPGDTGGLTYAGIARNANQNWPGWLYVDRGETPPTALVREIYERDYWAPIKGDYIRHEIAASIYDFGVNAGVKTAIKLAQAVCGVEADGVVGPKTVASLNAMAPDDFAARYFVAKVKRYTEICNRNPAQSKFLRGWLNRSLDALT